MVIDYNAKFIAVGFFYELLFQYPAFLPHPVALMGKAISLSERLFMLKKGKSVVNVFTGGLMAILLIGLTFSAFYFFERLISERWLLFIFRAFFTISCVAAGSLFFECMKVIKLIEANHPELAKRQLGMLVTRDTTVMDEKKVIETTLETLSENLCDGVIAPLFYLFLGGVPLAMAFKMSSTLDSMIGYKNEQYQYFGKFSARIDDILNFLPARLTALFLIIAAYFLNFDAKNAFQSWLKDKDKSESPNSGNPEAAFAGALGIRFGGEVSYFGKVYNKPYIGPGKREVTRNDVKSGIKLCYVTSLLFLIFGFAIEYLVRRFFIYV